MYRKGLKLKIVSREEINGVPVDRLDLPLDETRKNVLLVLRPNENCTREDIELASQWLGEQCEKLSGNLASYHGVVLPENNEWVLDVVEVDDSV